MFSFSLNSFVEVATKLRFCNLVGTFNLNGKFQLNKFGEVKLVTIFQKIKYQPIDDILRLAQEMVGCQNLSYLASIWK